jgi:precorrin-4/cobalt-precorrin-4 C11-methyltransferase
MPSDQPSAKPSKIYIVGAGPGDPDLITVKGQRLLQQADTIVYTNSLIPEALLQGVKPTAQCIPSADKSLAEIVAVLVSGARSQQLVVRLHDGDPCLYGAIGEQMNALLQAGVEFEIVPGISAYQLAAARLRVELTVPELVQSIILTRISGRTTVPAAEELSTMAAHQASLCLYLSARHVEKAQQQLQLHYPADTPVAICFRLGWEDEKIILTRLDRMAIATAEANLIRTTMYLISPALRASTIPVEYGSEGGQLAPDRRSRLYDARHDRLFRDGQPAIPNSDAIGPISSPHLALDPPRS